MLLIMQEKVHGALGADCAKHCQVAGIRGNTLLLQADSATWGTRIRLNQNAILNSIATHKEFSKLTSLDVKIRPKITKRSRQIQRKAISDDAKEIIAETAQGVNYPGLKNALLSLSRHQSSQPIDSSK